MHGPGERVRGQVGGGAVHEGGQGSAVEDADGGLGVVGQPVAFGVGEGGVEQHRHQSHPGGAEHGADQVRRRAEGEDHPVTGPTTSGQEGAGGAALAVRGVGGTEDLDGGSGVDPGHRGSVGPHRATMAWRWKTMSTQLAVAVGVPVPVPVAVAKGRLCGRGRC